MTAIDDDARARAHVRLNCAAPLDEVFSLARSVRRPSRKSSAVSQNKKELTHAKLRVASAGFIKPNFFVVFLYCVSTMQVYVQIA